jgi:hypothetical protein
MKGCSGYCSDCAGALKTAANERPDELRCTKCGEWKADEEFRAARRKTRRGRHYCCRKCETAARRDYRRRHPDADARYYKNEGV